MLKVSPTRTTVHACILTSLTRYIVHMPHVKVAMLERPRGVRGSGLHYIFTEQPMYEVVANAISGGGDGTQESAPAPYRRMHRRTVPLGSWPNNSHFVWHHGNLHGIAIVVSPPRPTPHRNPPKTRHPVTHPLLVSESVRNVRRVQHTREECNAALAQVLRRHLTGR